MHGFGKIYYPTNQVAEGVWERNHNIELKNLANDPSTPTVIQKLKSKFQVKSQSSGIRLTGSNVINAQGVETSNISSNNNNNAFNNNNAGYNNAGYNQSSGVYSNYDNNRAMVTN